MIDYALFFGLPTLPICYVFWDTFQKISLSEVFLFIGLTILLFIIACTFYRLSQFYYIINNESITFRNNKRVFNILWKDVSYIEIVETKSFLKVFNYYKTNKILFRERNKGNLHLSLLSKGISTYWFCTWFHALSDKQLIAISNELIPICHTEDDMQFKTLIINYLKQAHPEVNNIPSDL